MAKEVKITIINATNMWTFTRQLISNFVILSMLFGPGILLDSDAMQWSGFIMLICLGIGWLLMITNANLTVEEARDLLDKIEADNSNYEEKKMPDTIEGFTRLADDSYEPLDPRDAELLNMMTNCTMRYTTLPSGVTTPDRILWAHRGRLYKEKQED